ncbi:hypothetical protein ACW95P_03285 [Candidatus Mycoplasma pogonae]
MKSSKNPKTSKTNNVLKKTSLTILSTTPLLGAVLSVSGYESQRWNESLSEWINRVFKSLNEAQKFYYNNIPTFSTAYWQDQIRRADTAMGKIRASFASISPKKRPGSKYYDHYNNADPTLKAKFDSYWKLADEIINKNFNQVNVGTLESIAIHIVSTWNELDGFSRNLNWYIESKKNLTKGQQDSIKSLMAKWAEAKLTNVHTQDNLNEAFIKSFENNKSEIDSLDQQMVLYKKLFTDAPSQRKSLNYTHASEALKKAYDDSIKEAETMNVSTFSTTLLQEINRFKNAIQKVRQAYQALEGDLRAWFTKVQELISKGENKIRSYDKLSNLLKAKFNEEIDELNIADNLEKYDNEAKLTNKINEITNKAKLINDKFSDLTSTFNSYKDLLSSIQYTEATNKSVEDEKVFKALESVLSDPTRTGENAKTLWRPNDGLLKKDYSIDSLKFRLGVSVININQAISKINAAKAALNGVEELKKKKAAKKAEAITLIQNLNKLDTNLKNEFQAKINSISTTNSSELLADFETKLNSITTEATNLNNAFVTMNSALTDFRNTYFTNPNGVLSTNKDSEKEKVLAAVETIVAQKLSRDLTTTYELQNNTAVMFQSATTIAKVENVINDINKAKNDLNGARILIEAQAKIDTYANYGTNQKTEAKNILGAKNARVDTKSKFDALVAMFEKINEYLGQAINEINNFVHMNNTHKTAVINRIKAYAFGTKSETEIKNMILSGEDLVNARAFDNRYAEVEAKLKEYTDTFGTVKHDDASNKVEQDNKVKTAINSIIQTPQITTLEKTTSIAGGIFSITGSGAITTTISRIQEAIRDLNGESQLQNQKQQKITEAKNTINRLNKLDNNLKNEFKTKLDSLNKTDVGETLAFFETKVNEIKQEATNLNNKFSEMNNALIQFRERYFKNPDGTLATNKDIEKEKVLKSIEELVTSTLDRNLTRTYELQNNTAVMFKLGTTTAKIDQKINEINTAKDALNGLVIQAKNQLKTKLSQVPLNKLNDATKNAIRTTLEATSIDTIAKVNEIETKAMQLVGVIDSISAKVTEMETYKSDLNYTNASITLKNNFDTVLASLVTKKDGNIFEDTATAITTLVNAGSTAKSSLDGIEQLQNQKRQKVTEAKAAIDRLNKLAPGLRNTYKEQLNDLDISDKTESLTAFEAKVNTIKASPIELQNSFTPLNEALVKFRNKYYKNPEGTKADNRDREWNRVRASINPLITTTLYNFISTSYEIKNNREIIYKPGTTIEKVNEAIAKIEQYTKALNGLKNHKKAYSDLIKTQIQALPGFNAASAALFKTQIDTLNPHDDEETYDSYVNKSNAIKTAATELSNKKIELKTKLNNNPLNKLNAPTETAIISAIDNADTETKLNEIETKATELAGVVDLVNVKITEMNNFKTDLNYTNASAGPKSSFDDALNALIAKKDGNIFEDTVTAITTLVEQGTTAKNNLDGVEQLRNQKQAKVNEAKIAIGNLVKLDVALQNEFKTQLDNLDKTNVTETLADFEIKVNQIKTKATELAGSFTSLNNALVKFRTKYFKVPDGTKSNNRAAEWGKVKANIDTLVSRPLSATFTTTYEIAANIGVKYKAGTTIEKINDVITKIDASTEAINGLKLHKAAYGEAINRQIGDLPNFNTTSALPFQERVNAVDASDNSETYEAYVAKTNAIKNEAQALNTKKSELKAKLNQVPLNKLNNNTKTAIRTLIDNLVTNDKLSEIEAKATELAGVVDSITLQANEMNSYKSDQNYILASENLKTNFNTSLVNLEAKKTANIYNDTDTATSLNALATAGASAKAALNGLANKKAQLLSKVSTEPWNILNNNTKTAIETTINNADNFATLETLDTKATNVANAFKALKTKLANLIPYKDNVDYRLADAAKQQVFDANLEALKNEENKTANILETPASTFNNLVSAAETAKSHLNGREVLNAAKVTIEGYTNYGTNQKTEAKKILSANDTKVDARTKFDALVKMFKNINDSLGEAITKINKADHVKTSYKTSIINLIKNIKFESKTERNLKSEIDTSVNLIETLNNKFIPLEIKLNNYLATFGTVKHDGASNKAEQDNKVVQALNDVLESPTITSLSKSTSITSGIFSATDSATLDTAISQIQAALEALNGKTLLLNQKQQKINEARNLISGLNRLHSDLQEEFKTRLDSLFASTNTSETLEDLEKKINPITAEATALNNSFNQVNTAFLEFRDRYFKNPDGTLATNRNEEWAKARNSLQSIISLSIGSVIVQTYSFDSDLRAKLKAGTTITTVNEVVKQVEAAKNALNGLVIQAKNNLKTKLEQNPLNKLNNATKAAIIAAVDDSTANTVDKVTAIETKATALANPFSLLTNQITQMINYKTDDDYVLATTNLKTAYDDALTALEAKKDLNIYSENPNTLTNLVTAAETAKTNLNGLKNKKVTLKSKLNQDPWNVLNDNTKSAITIAIDNADNFTTLNDLETKVTALADAVKALKTHWNDLNNYKATADYRLADNDKRNAFDAGLTALETEKNKTENVLDTNLTTLNTLVTTTSRAKNDLNGTEVLDNAKAAIEDYPNYGTTQKNEAQNILGANNARVDTRTKFNALVEMFKNINNALGQAITKINNQTHTNNNHKTTVINRIKNYSFGDKTEATLKTEIETQVNGVESFNNKFNDLESKLKKYTDAFATPKHNFATDFAVQDAKVKAALNNVLESPKTDAINDSTAITNGVFSATTSSPVDEAIEKIQQAITALNGETVLNELISASDSVINNLSHLSDAAKNTFKTQISNITVTNPAISKADFETQLKSIKQNATNLNAEYSNLATALDQYLNTFNTAKYIEASNAVAQDEIVMAALESVLLDPTRTGADANTLARTDNGRLVNSYNINNLKIKANLVVSDIQAASKKITAAIAALDGNDVLKNKKTQLVSEAKKDIAKLIALSSDLINKYDEQLTALDTTNSSETEAEFKLKVDTIVKEATDLNAEKAKLINLINTNPLAKLPTAIKEKAQSEINVAATLEELVPIKTKIDNVTKAINDIKTKVAELEKVKDLDNYKLADGNKQVEFNNVIADLNNYLQQDLFDATKLAEANGAITAANNDMLNGAENLNNAKTTIESLTHLSEDQTEQAEVKLADRSKVNNKSTLEAVVETLKAIDSKLSKAQSEINDLKPLNDLTKKAIITELGAIDITDISIDEVENQINAIVEKQKQLIQEFDKLKIALEEYVNLIGENQHDLSTNKDAIDQEVLDTLAKVIDNFDETALAKTINLDDTKLSTNNILDISKAIDDINAAKNKLNGDAVFKQKIQDLIDNLNNHPDLKILNTATKNAIENTANKVKNIIELEDLEERIEKTVENKKSFEVTVKSLNDVKDTPNFKLADKTKKDTFEAKLHELQNQLNTQNIFDKTPEDIANFATEANTAKDALNGIENKKQAIKDINALVNVPQIPQKENIIKKLNDLNQINSKESLHELVDKFKSIDKVIETQKKEIENLSHLAKEVQDYFKNELANINIDNNQNEIETTIAKKVTEATSLNAKFAELQQTLAEYQKTFDKPKHQLAQNQIQQDKAVVDALASVLKNFATTTVLNSTTNIASNELSVNNEANLDVAIDLIKAALNALDGEAVLAQQKTNYATEVKTNIAAMPHISVELSQEFNAKVDAIFARNGNKPEETLEEFKVLVNVVKVEAEKLNAEYEKVNQAFIDYQSTIGADKYDQATNQNAQNDIVFDALNTLVDPKLSKPDPLNKAYKIDTLKLARDTNLDKITAAIQAINAAKNALNGDEVVLNNKKADLTKSVNEKPLNELNPEFKNNIEKEINLKTNLDDLKPIEDRINDAKATIEKIKAEILDLETKQKTSDYKLADEANKTNLSDILATLRNHLTQDLFNSDNVAKANKTLAEAKSITLNGNANLAASEAKIDSLSNLTKDQQDQAKAKLAEIANSDKNTTDEPISKTDLDIADATFEAIDTELGKATTAINGLIHLGDDVNKKAKAETAAINITNLETTEATTAIKSIVDKYSNLNDEFNKLQEKLKDYTNTFGTINHDLSENKANIDQEVLNALGSVLNDLPSYPLSKTYDITGAKLTTSDIEEVKEASKVIEKALEKLNGDQVLEAAIQALIDKLTSDSNLNTLNQSTKNAIETAAKAAKDLDILKELEAKAQQALIDKAKLEKNLNDLKVIEVTTNYKLADPNLQSEFVKALNDLKAKVDTENIFDKTLAEIDSILAPTQATEASLNGTNNQNTALRTIEGLKNIPQTPQRNAIANKTKDLNSIDSKTKLDNLVNEFSEINTTIGNANNEISNLNHLAEDLKKEFNNKVKNIKVHSAKAITITEIENHVAQAKALNNKFNELASEVENYKNAMNTIRYTEATTANKSDQNIKVREALEAILENKTYNNFEADFKPLTDEKFKPGTTAAGVDHAITQIQDALATLDGNKQLDQAKKDLKDKINNSDGIYNKLNDKTKTAINGAIDDSGTDTKDKINSIDANTKKALDTHNDLTNKINDLETAKSDPNYKLASNDVKQVYEDAINKLKEQLDKNLFDTKNQNESQTAITNAENAKNNLDGNSNLNKAKKLIEDLATLNNKTKKEIQDKLDTIAASVDGDNSKLNAEVDKFKSIDDKLKETLKKITRQPNLSNTVKDQFKEKANTININNSQAAIEEILDIIAKDAENLNNKFNELKNTYNKYKNAMDSAKYKDATDENKTEQDEAVKAATNNVLDVATTPNATTELQGKIKDGITPTDLDQAIQDIEKALNNLNGNTELQKAKDATISKTNPGQPFNPLSDATKNAIKNQVDDATSKAEVKNVDNKAENALNTLKTIEDEIKKLKEAKNSTNYKLANEDKKQQLDEAIKKLNTLKDSNLLDSTIQTKLIEAKDNSTKAISELDGQQNLEKAKKTIDSFTNLLDSEREKAKNNIPITSLTDLKKHLDDLKIINTAIKDQKDLIDALPDVSQEAKNKFKAEIDNVIDVNKTKEENIDNIQKIVDQASGINNRFIHLQEAVDNYLSVRLTPTYIAATNGAEQDQKFVDVLNEVLTSAINNPNDNISSNKFKAGINNDKVNYVIKKIHKIIDDLNGDTVVEKAKFKYIDIIDNSEKYKRLNQATKETLKSWIYHVDSNQTNWQEKLNHVLDAANQALDLLNNIKVKILKLETMGSNELKLEIINLKKLLEQDLTKAIPKPISPNDPIIPTTSDSSQPNKLWWLLSLLGLIPLSLVAIWSKMKKKK